MFTKIFNKFFKKELIDTRVWKLSFKSYQNGKLVKITYFCEATREFKDVLPEEEIQTGWLGHVVGFDAKHTPERIKYAKDILQPFKSDGTVNPEFVKVYKKDPRTDPSHRNYARNVNNQYAAQNAKVDQEFRKYEKKKYGI